MRKILALLLFSHALFGAAAFDHWTDGYAGAGSHSISVTASGTNNSCILFVLYRTGSTGTPTCGGNAMTLAQHNAVAASCFAGQMDEWVYTGALSGSVTVTITATVESQMDAITVNGANQTGQPDAVAAFVTGTGTGGAFATYPLPITTVASNSIALGNFCGNSINRALGSSNGTFIGCDGTGFGTCFWYSTTNFSAGSNTLFGAAVSSTGLPYNAQGLSIASVSAPSVFVPNPTVIIVGP